MNWTDRRSARPGMSADRKSYKVSDNVTVKSPDGKPLDSKSLKGARQARAENRTAEATPSKSEAKANARGLKAANSDSQFKVNKPMTRLFGGSMQVGKTVQAERGSKKEARLQKGQAWADSYSKKSSEKYDASIKKQAQKFAEKSKRKAGK
jgi:hypothetical protein